MPAPLGDAERLLARPTATDRAPAVDCVFQPSSVIQIGLAPSPWSAITAWTSRYAENV